METTLSITSRLPPPPTATDPHNLLRLRNVQDKVQFSMPLIDLASLRRITTDPPYRFRLKHHITSITPKFMADEPNKTEPQTPVGEIGDEKKIGSEEKSVPPPPEKPLPGDCCGSGCVRCVWDIYYEEVEEYDRLYKSK